MAECNFVSLMSDHDFSAVPAEELALNSIGISRMIKKQRNERYYTKREWEYKIRTEKGCHP